MLVFQETHIYNILNDGGALRSEFIDMQKVGIIHHDVDEAGYKTRYYAAV